MSKGTPSRGKRGKKKTHIHCPRCGNRSVHRRTEICASCGHGKSAKLKKT